MDLRVTEWEHSGVVYNCTGQDVIVTGNHGSQLIFPVENEHTFSITDLYQVRPEQFHGATIKVVGKVSMPDTFEALLERANVEQAVMLVDFVTALTVRRWRPAFQGVLLVPIGGAFVQY